MSPAICRWLISGLLAGVLLLTGTAHAQESGFYDYLFEDLAWPDVSFDTSSPSAQTGSSGDESGFFDFVIGDISWPEFTFESPSVSVETVSGEADSVWDFVIADISWPDNLIDPTASF